MEQDLISVVIPTYNRANTIVDCLNSVANQTYKNLEIIVVDDCSTDNTEEVVKSYPDERVIFYRLDKNRRACYARNYGAHKSHGKYIAFQDSDDIWHLDKIAKEVDFIKKEKTDFVFCGMNRISNNQSTYFPTQKHIDTRHNFFEQELRWNAVSTQTILMKREVIDQVEFDIDFRKYQDWDFAIRVSKAFSVSYLPEALVDSYLQDNSISTTVNHFESIYRVYEKYFDYINKNDDIYANYQKHFGDCLRKTNPKKAKEYYKNCLNKKISINVLIKYILLSLGIKF